MGNPLRINPMRLLTPALLALSALPARADDWPQWGGPRRDLVWRETGIVRTLPTPGLLPRLWATPIGEGYAGPAVADGRVFVCDLVDRQGQKGTERVLALDAGTGKVLWTHAYPVEYRIDYPAGPRATPVVDGPCVYTVGAMGDFFCLEAATGKVVWKMNLPADQKTLIPKWGMAASPLIDGGMLILLVGAKDALVVSFDKLTGQVLWSAIDDPEVGYGPPVLVEIGGVRQVIEFHPRAVTSIDPANGKVLWEVPFKSKSGLTVPTPRQVGNRVFVTAFYNGPLMIEVGADGRAAVGDARRDGQRPLVERLPDPERGPLFHPQRAGGADHRRAVAGRLQGDQPREAD